MIRRIKYTIDTILSKIALFIKFYEIEVDGIVRIIKINYLNVIFFMRNDDEVTGIYGNMFISLYRIVHREVLIYYSENRQRIDEYDDFNIQIIVQIDFATEQGWGNETYHVSDIAINDIHNRNGIKRFMEGTLADLIQAIEMYRIVEIENLTIRIV